MKDIHEKKWDRDGEDFQLREFYSLNAMIETEALDSPISKMLEYWLELKNGAVAPPIAEDFEISKLWRMKIPNRVTLIDCSTENPYDFNILRHAYDVLNIDWCYGKSITGRRIGTVQSRMVSRSAQADYKYAKEFTDVGSLRFQGLRQRINGMDRNFMRLLLPFSDINGDVSMIGAVTRQRTLAEFGVKFEPHDQKVS